MKKNEWKRGRTTKWESVWVCKNKITTEKKNRKNSGKESKRILEKERTIKEKCRILEEKAACVSEREQWTKKWRKKKGRTMNQKASFRV